MINHSSLEIKNSFLEQRGLLLKEFYTDPNTGKKIRTYETTFDNTFEGYVNSMSKFVAVVRYMPEFTGIGKTFKIGSTKADIVDVIKKGGKGDMANFAQAVIERELGLEHSHREALKGSSLKKL